VRTGATRALGGTLVLGLIAGSAGVAHAGPRDVKRLRAGALLYAVPGLPDPNFAQSVVLLVHYGPDGATGFVVNAPLRLTLGEAVHELQSLPGASLPLYRGGPVGKDGLLVLLRSAKAVPDALHVGGDVYMSGRLQDLRAALARDDAERAVRAYVGYAGWAAGQLDAEVSQDGWVVGPPEPEAAFAEEPEALWSRVYELMHRIEARAGPAQTRAASASRPASSTSKRVPPAPGATQRTSPPWARAISRTSARPSPAPPPVSAAPGGR